MSNIDLLYPRVSLIITNKSKILLIYRYYPEIINIFNDAKSPEYYVIPGGTMEEGENVEATAVREGKEETGLDIILDKVVLTERDEKGRVEHVCKIKSFTGKLELGGPEKEKMDENNIYKLEWIDLENIKSINLPQRVKKYLLDLIDRREI